MRNSSEGAPGAEGDLSDVVARLSAQVDYLTSKEQIRECLWRYCRGLDRHDEALERSIFWPEAEIGYGEVFYGDLETFVAWADSNHDRQFDMHQHHITNLNVELAGDDAHAESYVIYFLREKDGAAQRICGARYIDRFQRRDGEWRIILREFMLDVQTYGPVAKGALGFPPTGPGAWDRSDLSYQRPLKPRPQDDPTRLKWKPASLQV